MTKWLITENYSSINQYIVEADTEDEAIELFEEYDLENSSIEELDNIIQDRYDVFVEAEIITEEEIEQLKRQ